MLSISFAKQQIIHVFSYWLGPLRYPVFTSISVPVETHTNFKEGPKPHNHPAKIGLDAAIKIKAAFQEKCKDNPFQAASEIKKIVEKLKPMKFRLTK